MSDIESLRAQVAALTDEVRPRAWAMAIHPGFGGGDYVTTRPTEDGLPFEPLYDQAAINAAVATQVAALREDAIRTQNEIVMPLRAQVAALQEQHRGWLAANGPGGWIDDLRAQVAALEAERDALREDAERYRWLRNVPSGFEAQRIVNDTPIGMDYAIDAARSKT